MFFYMLRSTVVALLVEWLDKLLEVLLGLARSAHGPLSVREIAVARAYVVLRHTEIVMCNKSSLPNDIWDYRRK
jgi:hypothetical protein